MNILVITSSYPATPQDPSGAAGLFVRDLALQFVRKGHRVVVQPVGRKSHYEPDPGLTIVPLPWRGGDQELASLNFYDVRKWPLFIKLFTEGYQVCQKTVQEHHINRIICLWVVPSGIFGLLMKRQAGISYGVWALGSDIWKIKKIPWAGKWLLRKIISTADMVFADGVALAQDVTAISRKPCGFLPSCRSLPPPAARCSCLTDIKRKHLLFVGRYHPNKGPDLLLQAMSLLTPQCRCDVFLYMFGLGPMENILHRLHLELNLQDCVSIGRSIEAQDLANILNQVTFLVIPSRIESIPIIFSDAIQAGTPVISTPVGDLPALIHEFSCGEVAESTTPKDLAQAIEKALQSDAGRYQKGAREAKNRFDIQESANRWL